MWRLTADGCRRQQYAEGSVLDLDAMLAESNNRTPMVCLLSMGSDPPENIERLAKNKVRASSERAEVNDDVIKRKNIRNYLNN